MISRLAERLGRLRRLALARLHLATGDVEAALGLLRDPRLSGDSNALALRRRLEDPAPERDPGSSRIRRVEALLCELRAEVSELARRSSATARPAPSAALSGATSPGSSMLRVPIPRAAGRPAPLPPIAALRCASSAGSRGAVEARPPRACRLAIDDGGEFLLTTGEAFVLGHLRSGLADLPLFADLESRHAKLERGESFHGGARWRLSAIEGENLRVRRGSGDEHVLVRGGAAFELADGDLVELGSRVAFRFELPDAASVTARLEFLHGLECLGAPRVLLLAPGGAGRVRVGARRGRHVPLDDVEDDLVLEESSPGVLRVSHAAGLVFAGEADLSFQRELPLPPTTRIDFSLARRTRTSAADPERRPALPRPPIGVSLSPLEECA